jgi:hypothetical protein
VDKAIANTGPEHLVGLAGVGFITGMAMANGKCMAGSSCCRVEELNAKQV